MLIEFQKERVVLAKIISWIFFIAISIISPVLNAKNEANKSLQHLHFKQILFEQGLSQSAVYCILQDKKGFMWFGTQEGLNRFDGYEMKVYKHDPKDINSLSDNYILCMCEDTEVIYGSGPMPGA